MSKTEQRVHLELDGLHCPACELNIEMGLEDLEGVGSVGVSYVSNTADVVFDPDRVSLDDIRASIVDAGYRVVSPEAEADEADIEADAPSGNSSLFLIGLILVGIYLIIQNTIGFGFFPQVSQGMGYGMLFVVGLFTSVHCIAMCGGIGLSQSGAGRAAACDDCESGSCGGCADNGICSKLKPSLMYNLGRVTSYTILGGIVGALGSVIAISSQGKAIISVLAGVFMVLMGINMLGVSSRLRKFMPRLPKSITSKVARGRGGKAPYVVGLINGFMPCGPLQAMQLYALGTGSLVAGALSMFLFSLGTVPLMFAFGAFSSLVSSNFTKQMMKVSAALVIVLGIVMGNRGMLLAGVDVKSSALEAVGISQKHYIAQAMVQGDIQTVTTQLESGRYFPISVYSGIPVKWTIVADEGTINGCNNEITIPEYGVKQKLELGENIIEFTPQKTGQVVYTCWMGMISSTITVATL